MNTINLVEKVKEKIKETDEIIIETQFAQKKLLSGAKDFNLRLRNYIEADINEKNSFADSQEKLAIVKTRIENCKQSITTMKEKVKNIRHIYNL